MSTHQPKAAKGGKWRAPAMFGALAVLFILEGTVSNSFFSGHWDNALGILRVGLISAILALGVNIQWGYAGLFNTGVVGFLALGGLAPVLVSMPPTPGAFAAGGWGVLIALCIAMATLVAAVFLHGRLPAHLRRQAEFYFATLSRALSIIFLRSLYSVSRSSFGFASG